MVSKTSAAVAAAEKALAAAKAEAARLEKDAAPLVGPVVNKLKQEFATSPKAWIAIAGFIVMMVLRGPGTAAAINVDNRLFDDIFCLIESVLLLFFFDHWVHVICNTAVEVTRIKSIGTNPLATQQIMAVREEEDDAKMVNFGDPNAPALEVRDKDGNTLLSVSAPKAQTTADKAFPGAPSIPR